MLVTYITANYFSCQQLKLTKKTFEEVEKGGTDTHDLADAAKKQAANTENLAIAAKDEVAKLQAGVEQQRALVNKTQDAMNLTRKNFAHDQRPYVWYSSVKPLPFAANQRMFANIYFVNYGKSPAIRHGGAGTIFYGKDALGQADQWFTKLGDKPLSGSGSQGIIPPGIPADPEKTPIFTTVFSATIPTQTDVDYVAAHDFSAVIATRLEYSDTTGNFYRSDICVFHLATTAIANCEKHNELK